MRVLPSLATFWALMIARFHTDDGTARGPGGEYSVPPLGNPPASAECVGACCDEPHGLRETEELGDDAAALGRPHGVNLGVAMVLALGIWVGIIVIGYALFGLVEEPEWP